MRLTCLTQLYTAAGLLVDGDGDGLPDGFGFRFHPGLNPGAIDVAARLGLESAAFSPGFTSGDPAGLPIWFGPGNPEGPDLSPPAGYGLISLTGGGLLVTGSDRQTGWMAARWLAETYPFTAPGGPLLGVVAEGRPVAELLLRDGAVEEIRYGDAATPRSSDKKSRAGEPVPPPFLAQAPGDLPPEGLGQLFTTAGLLGSSDGARHDRAGWQVQMAAGITASEIAALCELAARTGVEATGLRFPLAVTGQPTGTAVILSDSPPPGPAWRRGDLAWSPGCLTAFGSPEERAAALRAAAAEAGLVEGLHATLFTRRAALPPSQGSEPEGEPAFDLALEQEWEVDRFRRVWREQVLPQVQAGHEVEVDLRLSEPLEIRAALAEEMTADLAGRGVPAVSLRVLSAYKQGFHWLEEEVLPALLDRGGAARVEVTCARFGSGATRGGTASVGEAPAPGQAREYRGPEGRTQDGAPLEMPIRWLQELYPADEMLAAALGAQVAFDLAAEPQGEIYSFRAWDSAGALVYEEGFSPVCSARTYMPEFPARGRVHPGTGLLRVAQGGRTLVEIALDTDLEAFWTAYQEQVLPRLRQHVADRHGPVPDPARQPFFRALVVEVAASEDDRLLPVRQERISPLDALHEDLYFHTLDYLNELGLSLGGKGYPAPGAVEPWVGPATPGALRARIRLYPGQPGEGAAEEAAHLPAQAAPGLPDPASAIPSDQVIGPDQLLPLLSYLARLPGVRVLRAGLSLAGRPTWALSVTAPTAGRIAPPQKLSAWRPTLLINARRHANEISSTNSILRLAELAAGDHDLLRRINLVLSPMDNIDGAALHYAMHQIHPTWKLHAARFNAAGVDFSYDCFAAPPRFGESRTLPTLWRACLPDVVLDDHGYPAHEWVQPFSGYNSPPYFPTSWWMPNALIYGIHRWLDPEKYPANAQTQSALRDGLARRIASVPEVAEYSHTLLDRYLQYGRRHLPQKFPLEMHEGVFSLVRQVADGPDSRTFSGRFPHITAAELITEVPDETAQGGYLALCAQAHLEGDLAVIETMTAAAAPVARLRTETPEGVLWTVGRARPLGA